MIATARADFPEFEALAEPWLDVAAAELAAVFAEILKAHNIDDLSYASLVLFHDDDMVDMSFFYPTAHSLLRMDVSCDLPLAADAEMANAAVEPFLKAHRCAFLTATLFKGNDTFRGRYVDSLQVSLGVPPDMTLRQAIEVGGIVNKLLTEELFRPTMPFGAHSIVLAGMVEALVGQTESQWLEAKSKGYGLQNDRQKHELSMDVAAMANSDTGGVIVIGFTTKRDSTQQDVITTAPGCSAGSLLIDAYAEILQSRVVPPIAGIDVRIVEADGRHYMSIFVPQQPDYMKPFLVKGGVIDGDRWTGSAFSIPERVGSSKWAMSAEAVHSLLVAARASLANRIPETRSVE